MCCAPFCAAASCPSASTCPRTRPRSLQSPASPNFHQVSLDFSVTVYLVLGLGVGEERQELAPDVVSELGAALFLPRPRLCARLLRCALHRCAPHVPRVSTKEKRSGDAMTVYEKRQYSRQ
eukprot:1897737-Rhodomonas_salina.2